MVTVRVGADRQEFCIHKEVLSLHSTYFAKALCGQFLEAQTRTFELEDIHIALFKVFVAWLYTGKIAYESSGSGASSFDDMEKLDIALQEENPYEMEEEDDDDEGKDKVDDLSRFQEGQPQTWTHLILGALFVLSDRLDAATLKRQVLDTMIERFAEAMPSYSAILYAYANTTRNCPLRRLLVHIGAYETSFKSSHRTWNHLPVDYLTAVMVAMGRRLPSRQCDSCYNNALNANRIIFKDIDDVDKESDQPPYKRDICFYHEHKDVEEKNACYAAREEESDTESSSDDD